MTPAKFSNQQLAGQRLMVGFDGTDFNANLNFLIKDLKVGGLILFAGNLAAPDQIADLCRAVQDCAKTHGQPPLFIAIDQEGGQVARLQAPFTQFSGNPFMKHEQDAVHFAEVTATELKEVGINMNMAPVLDVAPENLDSIMTKRSFGADPAWVARLGIQVIEHLQTNYIMAVAKHFPGIGRTVLDSHLDLPVMEDNLSGLEQFDLIPFEAAIQHGVCGLMLSHIFYPKLDAQWPASLSSRIADDLLRKRMGFDGLVLTDDLDMGAIAKHFDIHTSMLQVLAADIDLALICHKGPNIEAACEIILQQIKDAPDMKDKAMRSAERIMRVKRKYLMD